VGPLSVDDLIELAHSEGLVERDAELRGLARRSLRMTSTDPHRADAWILTSHEWAAPGDSETLVAQIDLAAASAHASVLPTHGWLVLFIGPAGPSHSSAPRTARGVVLDAPAEVPSDLQPAELGAELVIPRLWHETVQRLEFEEAEADAYLRLRTRVHEVQGVEDDGDGGLGIAYQRLLGYPNETTGSMPSECARALDEGAPTTN
jgi:hypothetical protein